MKMNSLVEFTELLKNRLSDILFQEAENDKYIYLYLADGYWTAFEKSAYRLCLIYEPAMLLPMRLTFAPFPFVTASIMQDNLHTALRACLNFAQHYFERCFRGYFSADMRSVAGYVTNGSGKRDRKQSQKRLNKIL